MAKSPTTEPFWRRPIVRADADPLADLPVGGAAPADEEGDFPSPQASAVTALIAPADDPLADAETELPSETLKNFAAPRANGAAPPHDDAANSAPRPENPARVSFRASDQAAGLMASAPSPTLSVIEAQRRVMDSQMRSARAADAQRAARGNVALALEKFQRATMQTQTPEQLIRQHLESEAQLRADRAAGKIAPRGGQRRLGSAIDAYAFYTKASGRGAGGGAAFRRGATTRRGVSDLKALPGSGLPQIKE
jgi:hypothetical protein